MKNTSSFIILIMMATAILNFTYASPPKDDGKKIFVDKKCNSCHIVKSENIESKKKDATDLSNAGSKLKADFLVKYLKKEEKIKDNAHKVAFKGTDEELKTLSNWLETLKKK